MDRLIRMCVLLAALLVCSEAIAGDEYEWQLKGINGHLPAFWDNTKPNWSWDNGNPAKERSGQWTLFYQPDNNPPLEADIKVMTQGLAWKFSYVWRDDSDKSDPSFYYLGLSLSCNSRRDLGIGPASGVMFTPEVGGKYKVDLGGTIKVVAPSAGHARVSVYLLNQKTGDASLLQEFDLNSKGGYGNFPNSFAWSQHLAISDGNALVVRVQSINPGQGSCGKSTLTFSKFSIKRE